MLDTTVNVAAATAGTHRLNFVLSFSIGLAVIFA